jgi:hypothetical protein
MNASGSALRATVLIFRLVAAIEWLPNSAGIVT